MKIVVILVILLVGFSVFADTPDNSQLPKGNGTPTYEPKSYFVAIPLAFFVGFGSGHFYAKDTWGGIRYIAYDIASLGLGFLSLYLDDFSDRSIIFAIGVGVVNRIYQAVGAAESVHYYNKNPLLRELDLFDAERKAERLVINRTPVVKIELLEF